MDIVTTTLASGERLWPW